MDLVVIKGEAEGDQAHFRFLEGFEGQGFWLLKCEPLKDILPADAHYQMSDDYPENLELADFLHIFDRTLVVSSEAKDFLESVHVSGLEFIPVKVLNHKGRAVKRQYFVANCLKLVDCIDQDKTEFEWDDLDDTKMDDVSNLTIDESKIDNDALVFRMKHLPKFILTRRDLVDKIVAAGLQGLSVTEIADLDL